MILSVIFTILKYKYRWWRLGCEWYSARYILSIVTWPSTALFSKVSVMQLRIFTLFSWSENEDHLRHVPGSNLQLISMIYIYIYIYIYIIYPKDPELQWAHTVVPSPLQTSTVDSQMVTKWLRWMKNNISTQNIVPYVQINVYSGTSVPAWEKNIEALTMRDDRPGYIMFNYVLFHYYA